MKLTRMTTDLANNDQLINYNYNISQTSRYKEYMYQMYMENEYLAENLEQNTGFVGPVSL